ncbi:DUF7837 family putative zinc-binding protein [Halorussus halophilus]
MAEKQERLGDCPNCSESIADRDVLVRYEREDGTEGVYAECPGCWEVVSPS